GALLRGRASALARLARLGPASDGRAAGARPGRRNAAGIRAARARAVDRRLDVLRRAGRERADRLAARTLVRRAAAAARRRAEEPRSRGGPRGDAVCVPRRRGLRQRARAAAVRRHALLVLAPVAPAAGPHAGG